MQNVSGKWDASRRRLKKERIERGVQAVSDANNVFLGASARSSCRERIGGCEPSRTSRLGFAPVWRPRRYSLVRKPL